MGSEVGNTANSALYTLHHTDWRTHGPVPCDAVVADPPYGARTHDSEAERKDGHSAAGLAPDYSAWTPADVSEFVGAWSPVVQGWMVALTSHDLIPAWEGAYAKADRLCFAPIPCVMRGMSCRMLGDGPSSWTVYAIVARPRRREFMSWGTLPGAYTGPGGQEAGGGRGKPDWLMRALVRDYTRAGDLVADPFAGWGATLAAAIGEGRRAIGWEQDAAAHAEAIRRLARPVQLDLMGGVA